VSASRQIRALQGAGDTPAGNRKAPAPAPSAVPVGRSVSARIGKYEIEAELGGGVVRVFHARDRATGRRVTLKVLTDLADRARAERFRREVAAVANLRSASLISIYELGEHVGMPFAALEYLGDDHLGHAIADRRPFTLLDKMRIMWQVAEGVQAAHQAGLAYVGLCPSGIALGSDGSAKVQDFGIVRLTGDGASGVVPYQEPLAAGASLDSLSDLFAWGVIYYELLAAGYPFEQKGPLAADRPRAVVVPLRRLVPECPEPLEQLITRAMDPVREFRYQTFEDIHYDARPILREFERARAVLLVEDAVRLAQSREFDRALNTVREALLLDSGNPEAQRLGAELRALVQERTLKARIEALLHEGAHEAAGRRFERAAELLESAARLAPGNSQIGARLSEIRARVEQGRKTAQLLEDARQALAGKDLVVAEAKVLEAIENDPESPGAAELADEVGEAIRLQNLEARVDEALGKAKSLLLLESFDAAIEALEALEEESPGSAEVAQWLAHAEEQKQSHERRTRLHAGLSEARSLMHHQQLAESAELLESLHAEFPEEQALADLLVECGAAAERASTVADATAQSERFCHEAEFDRAIAVLELALAAYPEDAQLTALRSQVERKRRDFESAAALRQVLDETQWLLDQDRFDFAVQFLREKCALMPDQPKLAERLAEVERRQPEWERRRLVQDCLCRVAALEQAQQWPVALTVLEEALEACPASDELQRAAGRLRAQLREQERRKKLARWINDIRQSLADGELEQAEEALRRGLAALPDEPALLELGEELKRSRKFREEWHSAQVLVGRRQFEDAERILVRLDGNQHPEVQKLLRTVREARAANEEQDFYKRGREKALHLMQQGQLQQAADLFRNLLSLFPGDPILERDLQSIAGGPGEPKHEPNLEALAPPATPMREPVAETPPPRFEPVFPPPGPSAQARGLQGRWLVLAGGAFFVLVSVAAGVSRMFHSAAATPAPEVHKASSTPPPAPALVTPPPTAAPAPQPLVVDAAPPVLQSSRVESRQPAAGSRETKTAPAAPAPRPFNSSMLSKPASVRTNAALAPAPPTAGVPIPKVDGLMLPAGVTPSMRPLSEPPKETPPPAPQAPPPPKPGGNIQPVRPIAQPAPQMPLIAKDRRVSGVVAMDATVDKRGAVTQIKILSGSPLLIDAAREAVSRWRYQPAMLNGEPIDAPVHIEVRFDANPH
jgi:TonB family protein